MLYRLREFGLSVRVFETGGGVGGTWFWNRYPGARVDAPSMQYSLSFSAEMEQEWNWSEDYSPQVDLEKYANHIADRFHLREHITFPTTATRAIYDDATKRWVIDADRTIKSRQSTSSRPLAVYRRRTCRASRASSRARGGGITRRDGPGRVWIWGVRGSALSAPARPASKPSRP
jgi:hypothetical protein